MVNIASVIANRAALLGVTPQEVVANTNEFNAYNRQMPPGTADLVGMAEEAMNHVLENGPVNNATFYATPAAVDNLPSGLVAETETTGHQYFSDPQQRAIGTSLGYVQPNRYAFAQNLAAVPTPYSPEAAPMEGGLLSAFTATLQEADDPFSSILGNPQRVAVAPIPGPTVEGWSAMAAAEPMAAPVSTPTTEGWSQMAAAAPVQAPVSSPTIEGWSEMAAAQPMTAPMDSVTAQGLLAGVPAMEATTRAVPTVDAPATGILGVNPAMEANAVATPGFDMSRFGDVQPSTANFDQSRFDGAAPQVVSIDPARFGDINTTSFDQARFAPSIDVATNTQSFAPDPVSASATGILGTNPALAAQATVPSTFDVSRFGDVPTTSFDVGRFAPSIDVATSTTSFMDAPATAVATGINSPEHRAIQAQAEANLANPTVNTAFAATPVTTPATGILGVNPALAANATVPSISTQTGILSNPSLATPAFSQALNPSLPSLSTPAEVAFSGTLPSAMTPAQRAIESITSPNPGILSSTSLMSANPALTTAPVNNVLSTPSVMTQNAFATSFPAAVAQNRFEFSSPALATVDVADTPAVASIDGPANTPAVTQQRQQTVANATTTAQTQQPTVEAGTRKSFGDSLMSKETAIGGVLGGLALGPVGGVLGALAGQQVAANGGLTGLLSGPAPTSNFVGFGPSAVYGVYGGAPAGSYAVASDGSRVASTGGGWTTRTNSYGVTTSTSPWGGGASYHGPSIGGDPEADADAA